MTRPGHVVWGNTVIISQTRNKMCNSLKFFFVQPNRFSFKVISSANHGWVIVQECEVGGRTRDSTNYAIELRDAVINQTSKYDEGAQNGQKSHLGAFGGILLNPFRISSQEGDGILKQNPTNCKCNVSGKLYSLIYWFIVVKHLYCDTQWSVSVDVWWWCILPLI